MATVSLRWSARKEVVEGIRPRRWRGSASPRQGDAARPRSGRCAPRSVEATPPWRRQTLPDPPAHRTGHESAPGHRCALLYDRAAVYRIRIAVPAAWSGNARLAPTWRRNASTVGPVCPRSSATTRVVGIRRYLTHQPSGPKPHPVAGRRCAVASDRASVPVPLVPHRPARWATRASPRRALPRGVAGWPLVPWAGCGRIL